MQRDRGQFGRKAGWLLLALLALAPLCFAQEPDDAVPEVTQVPGERPENESVFGRLLPGRWSTDASLQVQSSYDDGLLREGDLLSSASMRVGVALRLARVRYELNYMPEYTYFRRFTEYNYQSHRVQQSLSMKLSARDTLTWNTSGAYLPTRGNLQNLGVGFGGSGNFTQGPQAVASDAISEILDTDLGFRHNFGRMAININGGASHTELVRDPVPGAKFAGSYRSSSLDGSFGITREIGTNRHLGIDFSYRYFLQPTQHAHGHYEAMHATYSQTIGRSYRISLAAGPSWQQWRGNTTAVNVTGDAEPSYDISASIARFSRLVNVDVQYSHTLRLGRVQNSLLGDNLGGQLSRTFARYWRVSVNGGWGRSLNLKREIFGNTYYAGGSVGRSFFERINASLQYTFVTQEQHFANPFLLAFDRNRVSLSLVWNLRRAANR